MKSLFSLTFLFLSFFFSGQSPSMTEKWNNAYNRYEYYNAEGELVAYKKYNESTRQWETFSENTEPTYRRNRSVPTLEYPTMSTSDIEYAKAMAQASVARERELQEEAEQRNIANKERNIRLHPVFEKFYSIRKEALDQLGTARNREQAIGAIEKLNSAKDFLISNGIDRGASYDIKDVNWRIAWAYLMLYEFEKSYDFYQGALQIPSIAPLYMKEFIKRAAYVDKLTVAKQFLQDEIKYQKGHGTWFQEEENYKEKYIKFLKKAKNLISKKFKNNDEMMKALNELK